MPFWLTSAILSPGETVEGWLTAQHIRPRWIDEIIQIDADAGKETLSISGIVAEVPWLHSRAGQVSEHFVLQGACREIAVGDRRMILLISLPAVVLLVAPAAVGMYNLFPQAYVEEFFNQKRAAADVPVLEYLEALLQKKQRKAAQLDGLLLVQAGGKRPVKAETAFSGAAWVKPPELLGALAGCHELVQALLQKKRGDGLAVEVTADQNLWATWIERV